MVDTIQKRLITVAGFRSVLYDPGVWWVISIWRKKRSKRVVMTDTVSHIFWINARYFIYMWKRDQQKRIQYNKCEQYTKKSEKCLTLEQKKIQWLYFLTTTLWKSPIQYKACVSKHTMTELYIWMGLFQKKIWKGTRENTDSRRKSSLILSSTIMHPRRLHLWKQRIKWMSIAIFIFLLIALSWESKEALALLYN